MKPFLPILLALCLLAAPAAAQTLKSLMFNTTNGQVVANTGTNVLTFTNASVFFNGNVVLDSLVANGTNIFETGILLNGGFFVDDNNTNNTNAVFVFQGDAEEKLRENARRDLGFSTNLNTLWTATNASNARTAVGLGEGQNVTFGGVYNALTLIDSDNRTVALAYDSSADQWTIDDEENFRAKLGLGATWLTNTNVANFKTAIGLGTNDEVDFQGITLTETTNSFTISSDAGVNRTNLGLGGGITTNISFVDASTNTNSVTISNGIITGWTQ